jgi:catechol 2,3-dioxygenase-like lactoylglutathione lyase family enzyme
MQESQNGKRPLHRSVRTHRLFALTLLVATFVYAQEPRRPPITGFSHVAFYTTSPDAARHFYLDLLGLDAGDQPGVYVVGRQCVALLAQKPPDPPSLLDHITFATPDAEGMRRYLQSRGVTVPFEVMKTTDGSRDFEVKDPEGNQIRFLQTAVRQKPQPKAISTQIIHVGFLVHDRAAEDKFYREILGFKPYWFGGMNEGHTDWVALQVPEGRQWIEYMLVDKGSEVTARRLGVLNHFSLGVSDMNAAEALLQQRGWTPTAGSRKQMGKDGKWQLNVYDPDGTRVELMEFTPKEKPCCSPFTAPHPGELQ